MEEDTKEEDSGNCPKYLWFFTHSITALTFISKNHFHILKADIHGEVK